MDPANARVLVEQYWAHARHQEDQRLRFAELYLAVVAALFAFAAASNLEPLVVTTLAWLVAASSVFGFVSAHLWGSTFVRFSRMAERVAVCELEMPVQYARFASPTNALPNPAQGGTSTTQMELGQVEAMKRVSAYRLFMALYLAVFSASVGAAVYLSDLARATNPLIAGLISGALVFVGGCLLILRWIEPRSVALIQKAHLEGVRACRDQDVEHRRAGVD